MGPDVKKVTFQGWPYVKPCFRGQKVVEKWSFLGSKFENFQAAAATVSRDFFFKTGSKNGPNLGQP